MSPEAKESLKKERERALAKKGIHTKAVPQQQTTGEDKRLTNQFATPENRREQNLLQRQARQSMLGSTSDPTLDEDWEDLLKGIK